MRNILRTLILAPVVMASAALATNSAMAEATLKVPFTFTAAGENCPAGNYVVSQDARRGVLTMSSQGTPSPRSFTWLLKPGDGTQSKESVSLKFDEQNGTHVLEAVQYKGLTTSNLVKKTTEKEFVPMEFGHGR